VRIRFQAFAFKWVNLCRYVWVGIFTKGVMPSSWTRQSSGLTDDLYICDFEFPAECLNEVPYADSDPDNPMECGESDETLPAAGYKCVVVKAPINDDGDFVFVGRVDRPVPLCLDGYGSSDTVGLHNLNPVDHSLNAPGFKSLRL
jgi:hypothetical protein